MVTRSSIHHEIFPLKDVKYEEDLEMVACPLHCETLETRMALSKAHTSAKAADVTALLLLH